jgi:type II secretory pathway pseudopilin PulG
MDQERSAMKLISINPIRRAPKRESGFTMVEIAIALGVIAFALIAIIGILPTGLQTQRDNREETLVNQDARLLIEAIKTGGRDLSSDIGAYVVNVDGTDTPNGIATTNLIQLLSTTNYPSGKVSHDIVMNSISGALETRHSDLGFRYQVRVQVTNAVEFAGSVLTNQVYEVRLRFAWPVLPNNKDIGSEANTYIARTLITGAHPYDVFYAQQYFQPPYRPATN